MCASCGWQAECAQCSARLVVHRDAGLLRCHHCGHARTLAVVMPALRQRRPRRRSASARSVSSERSPSVSRRRELRASIATARKRRGAFADVRDRVDAGAVDILVGTQMLAKGHDFPGLTLVGVLGADNALYSADFRATERLAALLLQVAGRAAARDCREKSSCRPISRSIRSIRRLPRTDYGEFAANRSCRAARGGSAAVRASSACSPRRRRAAKLSTRFWPAQCAARVESLHKARPSPCSRRCRRRSRGAREWSAARSSRKARTAARCSAFFPHGATRSKPCPEACALGVRRRSGGLRIRVPPALRPSVAVVYNSPAN